MVWCNLAPVYKVINKAVGMERNRHQQFPTLAMAGYAIEALWGLSMLGRVYRAVDMSQPSKLVLAIAAELLAPWLWRQLRTPEQMVAVLHSERPHASIPAWIYGGGYHVMNANYRRLYLSGAPSTPVRYRQRVLAQRSRPIRIFRDEMWLPGFSGSEFCITDLRINNHERYYLHVAGVASLFVAVLGPLFAPLWLLKRAGSWHDALFGMLMIAAGSHLTNALSSILRRHYLQRAPDFDGEPAYRYRGEDLNIHIGEEGAARLLRIGRIRRPFRFDSLIRQSAPVLEISRGLSHAVSDQRPTIRLPNIDMPAGLDDASVPDCFKCALMNTVMRNPVIDPRLPHIVYDLSSIMGWLRRKQTNPYTRQALRPAMLKPAYSVRAAMSDYLDSLRQAQTVASSLPGMHERRRVERLQRQVQQQWLIERRADSDQLQHAYDQRYGLTLT